MPTLEIIEEEVALLSPPEEVSVNTDPAALGGLAEPWNDGSSPEKATNCEWLVEMLMA